MSEKTFSAKTSNELYVLVGELTHAYELAEKYGYDFPIFALSPFFDIINLNLPIT
jgi:hypothetical protein